ncbi:MAG: transposase family protein [Wolbachia sp.]
MCTAFANGKQHDFRVFKESKVRMLSTTKVLADAGYRVCKNFTKMFNWPIENRKSILYQKIKKTENKSLFSQRVVVENVIGLLKRFKIISDRYRNRRSVSVYGSILFLEFTIWSCPYEL